MTDQHDSESGQEEIIAFLKDPSTHPEAAGEVRHVTTHVAHVFLAGERAWKIKRAVAYSFLDFTGLEAREEVCRREVELNRRTAPQIYLGVHAITRARDGGLEFDGAGETLDWVIEMRRFDQALMFDHLIEQGELEPRHIIDLVDRVHDLHVQAERLAAPYGGTEGLQGVVEENAEDMKAMPACFTPDAVADLTRRSRTALERVGPLLDRRREEGWVRQCHGDLHLGNVVLWQEQATPFDCIEFSQRIAGIDVVYDLAYLLMDLVNRDHRHFANLAMNRYLSRVGQVGVLDALPLMLSIRAAVRAKVTAAAVDAQEDKAEAERLTDAAGRFFALARQFLEPADQPRLIAVGGFSGTGKSTLAAGLAPAVGRAPGALHLRSDMIRKRLQGVAPETRLPQDAYSADVSRKVYDTLFAEATAALKAGQSVIADAVWAKPEERGQLEALARDCGAAFRGLWLEAPRETLEARIEGRRNDSSDATVSVLEHQLTHETGEIAWPRLDTGNGAEAVLARAQERLGLES